MLHVIITSIVLPAKNGDHKKKPQPPKNVHALMDNMIMEMELLNVTIATINVPHVLVVKKIVPLVLQIETMTHQNVVARLDLT